MALLHVLARVAPPLGVVVHAHGVDHGLRADAARELDVAEAFAARLAVPFARTRGARRARRQSPGARTCGTLRGARRRSASAGRSHDRHGPSRRRSCRDRAHPPHARLRTARPRRASGACAARRSRRPRARASASCARAARRCSHTSSDMRSPSRPTRRTRILVSCACACAVRSCRSSKSWRRGSSTTSSPSRISSEQTSTEGGGAFPLSRSVQVALAAARTVEVDDGPGLASRWSRGDRRSQSPTRSAPRTRTMTQGQRMVIVTGEI